MEISLTFLDDQGIRAINKEFRSIDKATDVLSFPLEEELSSLQEETGPLLLGDIIISTDKGLAQAEAYGHSLQRELVFLFVHGLLHLLGYDHEQPEEEAQMRAEQRAILKEMDISR